MSLQIAAKHLASHGRGPDTTLVHMTPGEVASLQSLAQQHGGSLTTNPHTGLPEAGFLSALLPMAAGAGLAAMGMPAGYAALAVGATSAATSGGDLKKGLMAGMSAYGGAGMAESFMGAGLGTMGGAMAAPAAEAAPAVAAAPAVSAAPAVAEIAPSAGSIAGSSMQEAVNQSGMYAPALTSAAPAQVAQQAAAATPAAQAAKQAAALNELTMGQRWDALKAGATGANAMKYVKDNPFTSLGVAASFMAPDENKAPQTTTDTDRGPRAGLQYHPGWSTPMPKPNMQGIEQTYNRPYYAAEGGITHMAEGGSTGYKDYDGVEMSPAMRELLAQQDRSLREIQRLKAQQAGTPPAQLDQKQLFADYLQRVAGGAGAGTGTGIGTGTGADTGVAKTQLPFLETPVASNTQGGGGRGMPEAPSAWSQMTPEERAAYYAEHPTEGKLALGAQDALGWTTLGGLAKAVGKDKWYDSRLEKMGVNPTINLEKQNQIAGTAMQKALDSQAASQARQQAIADANATGTVFGGYLPGVTPNPYSMGPGTPGFNAPLQTTDTGSPITFATAENPYSSQYGPDFSGGTGFGLVVNQQNSLNNALQSTPTAASTLGPNAQSILSNMERMHSLVSSFPRVAPSQSDASLSAQVKQQDARAAAEPSQSGGNSNNGGDGGSGYSNANAGNFGWTRSGGGEGGGWAAGGATHGGIADLHQYNLGSYSDGGRLLKGPGDGVSDSIPATIGKGRPARLADGEFVVPARIVSEIGNGSTEAGARKLYAMMDRIQAGRKKSIGKGKVAVNSRADKHLPA